MQKRDPLVQTLLSLFIPFYMLYWFYVTSKEVEQTYSQKMPSILLLIVPTIIAIILFPVLFIAMIGSAMSGSTEAGIASFAFLLFGVPLLFFAAWIIALIYDYKFSEGIENVVGPEAGKVLVFILLFFIAPAAVFVVQEKLNKKVQFGDQALAGHTNPQPQQTFSQNPVSPVQSQQPLSPIVQPQSPAPAVQPQQPVQPPTPTSLPPQDNNQV